MWQHTHPHRKHVLHLGQVLVQRADFLPCAGVHLDETARAHRHDHGQMKTGVLVDISDVDTDELIAIADVDLPGFYSKSWQCRFRQE